VRMSHPWVFPAFSFVALLLTIAFFFIFDGGWVNNWSGNTLRYFCALTCLVLIFSLAFHFLALSRKRILLAALALVYLVVGIGIAPLIAVSAVFLGSFFLGRFLLLPFTRSSEQHEPVSAIASLMVGLAFYLLFFSIASRYAVNSLSFYILALVPSLIGSLKEQNFSGASYLIYNAKKMLSVIESLNFVQYIVFIVLFTFVASYTFFPTIMWDENALHLSIWSQLATNLQYVPDVKSQIWSAEPFNVDLLHAVVSVLSQADARGALNFMLLCIMCMGVFKFAAFFTSNNNDRLLVLGLFLSTPMICNLLIGLQTDFFLAVLVTCGVWLLAGLAKQFSLVYVVALLAVCAMCASTKLPATLLAAGLGLAMLVILFQYRLQFQKLSLSTSMLLVLVLLISACLAFYPYVSAYLLTGNPVFPLYNGIFKSPHFEPNNFLDSLYVKGASFSSYAGWFFNTSSYFESKNYTAGFQYFLLFPIAVVIMLLKKQRTSLLLLIPLFVYAIPLFLTLQYWRYFFAVLPLCSLVLAVFLLDAGVNKWVKVTSRSVFYGFIFLNLMFMPGISFNFHTAPVQLYTHAGKLAFTQDVAPESLLNQQINQIDKQAKVLFDFSRPYGATLAGTPIYNSWYAPEYAQVIASWKTPVDISTSLATLGVNYVYMNLAQPYTSTAIQRNALRELLVNYGHPVLQSGSVTLYTLGTSPLTYSTFLTYARVTSVADFIVQGQPVEKEAGVVVSNTDILNKSFNAQSFRAFKYEATIACEGKDENFIAQINWDKGAPYYKLIECSAQELQFSETGQIPVGATKGILYLSAHAASKITVKSISLGGR
jgi:hypothetical protein